MTVVLAVLMALHGIAHLVGFLVPWGFVEPEQGELGTHLFAGRVELTTGAQRAAGLLWIPLALGFLVAAWGVWTGRPWWGAWTLVVAMVSLMACLAFWPDTRIGVPVNVAILVAVVAGVNLGWW